jgi:serine/threonine protein kinase
MSQPRHLGRYEIIRPLKRGGMAELFLARSSGPTGFEKRVVIKRILPEMARDAEYVTMFLEEARLAVGLHHSNIVQVFDVGEDDGSPFYAMEFLDGEDVHGLMRLAHLRGGAVPIEHALAIAIGAAAGLHHAHEQRDADGRSLGLVHRDVSPHNIAVTFEGGVKLLDFGVARTANRSLTRHGTLKGKVGYMSPEQCAGDELDRRSDIFALSVVLWELLAGRRLYGGRSDFGVMRSIVDVDAPSVPDCAEELDAIVRRGLMRDRQARFATAEEMQLALEALARERKLAVSGVGLGRFVRELVEKRAPVSAAPGERTTSLYSGLDDEDTGDATIVDGTIMPVRERRVTRQVVAPRRGWVGWVAAAVVVLGAGAGGLMWLRGRGEPPPAPPRIVTPAPKPAELPVPPAPPVDVHASEPANANEPAAVAEKPAPVRPKPTRKPPPHKRPTKPVPEGAVDLDAPLPPR